MPPASALALGQGTDRTVSPVSELLTERSVFFRGLLQEVRGVFGGRKVAEQLAEIWDCDVRSAARYLAGERTPGGGELASLLTHPKAGPAALAGNKREARMRLAAGEFETFELQMVKATLRAEWRQRDADL